MLKNLLLCLCVLVVFAGCSSSEEKSLDFVQKATQYLEDGKVAEAKVEAKNAIKLDPKAAKAYLILAKCSVTEQNWRGAFGAYAQAVKLDPDLTEAQIGLGRIYLLSRQYDKAEEIISTVLEKEPENVQAHLLRAGVLLQTKDLDGAQRILAAVLAKDPANIDAILGLVTAYERKDEPAEALATLNKALLENPKSLVLYFKSAALAEKMGDYDQAEKQYLKLLELTDKKEAVKLMIAKMYERSGNHDKAESMMTGLVHENPENVEYRLGLLGYLLKNGKLDEAITVVTSAPEEAAEDIRLSLAHADILLAQKKFDEASALLQEIGDKYQDHPLSAKALTKLAAIQLKDGKYETALATLDEATIRDSDPNILFMRAQTKMQLKDVEGAIADLRIVRKKLPDNYAARQLLARAYLAQDKGLMAVEELHDILESNADYSPSRSLLVKYYARYGQWDLAEEELSKLIEKTPDDASLLMAMADVKRMRGHIPEAKKIYESLLDNPKGRAPALLRLGFMAERDMEYAKALSYYESVLEEHPKSVAAIERKMFALLEAKKTDELDSFKQKLVATDDASPVLHDIFGRLAVKQGDWDAAEREFKQANKLAPDWPAPYQRLIGVYLAKKETDKVIMQCHAALKKNPDAFAEAFLLGQIYQMKGDVMRAEQAYKTVLEKKPDFLAAANNLAYLYAETAQGDEGRLADALELAKQAAQNDNPEALDTLGWVYHLMGNREQSIEVLNKAYEKSPENKAIAYHLAVVLAKWSYTAEAKRIIQHAVAGEKDFPERSKFMELSDSL